MLIVSIAFDPNNNTTGFLENFAAIIGKIKHSARKKKYRSV
jgi:hypothetical protein